MPQPCITAGQLLDAVRTDAPLLLLLAVDVTSASDGLGLPCRVVGTLSGAVPPPVHAPSPMAPAASSTQQITRMLTAIGVPSNLLGYAYLRTALVMLLAHPEDSHSLMRTLYPEVASQHHTTARCVERAIRHAIAQTWARGGGVEYEHLLGRMSSTVGEKPTNSEFLAQVAESLRMERAAG